MIFLNDAYAQHEKEGSDWESTWTDRKGISLYIHDYLRLNIGLNVTFKLAV